MAVLNREEPGDAVLVSLRRIIHAIALHSKELLRSHGLTGPQLVVLRELVRRGEATIGELAQAVRLSSATVTGIVTRLETRLLAERHRSVADRRRTDVRPTEHAHTLFARAPKPLQERFLSEFTALPRDEQNELVSALERLASMMDPHGLSPEPLLTLAGETDDVPGGAADI